MAIGKQIQSRSFYSDADNCKTMKSLGITGGEYFLASKNLPDDTIQQNPLLEQGGQKFTKGSERIFDMLFDMYAEPGGYWSKLSCHHFIMGCVGERSSGPDDSRVVDLFKTYDTDNDGKL